MADWGIKTSRIGYDVATAADYNLSFSSSWPLLKVYAQGRATITNMGASQTILTHNLGFPPMFFIWGISGSTAKFNSYGNVANGTGNGKVGSNSTSLIYTPDYAGSGTATIYYAVFYNSLELNYTAPTINSSGSTGTVDHDFGIKVSLPGYDVDNTDYRNFAVHSSAQAPMIHSVQNGPLTLTTIPTFPGGTYMETEHNLGYVPLAYCYAKYGTLYGGLFDPDSYYMFGGVGGVSDFRFLVSEATTAFHYWTDPCPITATIVTMKDSFTKDNTNVSY